MSRKPLRMNLKNRFKSGELILNNKNKRYTYNQTKQWIQLVDDEGNSLIDTFGNELGYYVITGNGNS